MGYTGPRIALFLFVCEGSKQMQTFTGFVADAFVYHHVRYHKIMKVTINRLKVATLQKQR